MPGGYFDLDASEIELGGLEKQIASPEFWNDQEKARSVSQRYDSLKSELDSWRSLRDEVEELSQLEALGDASLEPEIGAKLGSLSEQFRKMEFALMFSGEYDKGSAIVSIHAGTGGVDAQDWASMLLRMYLRFCERHGLSARIIDETSGAEAGIKSVVVEVIGRYAYGWLRSEGGVHRLVRISPFDAEKMRHTSFALVEVLPDMGEAQEFELKESDLKIEVMRAGGHGGQSVNTTDSAVRLTHIPTGIAVKCQNERSQLQNKASAMKILKAKLAAYNKEVEGGRIQEIKGEYRQAQWGNQARSYVLQPYKLAKDHRTGHETADVDRVIDGEFDDFVEAYLKQDVGK